MTRIDPVSLADLDKASDEFEATVTAALKAVANRVAGRMATRATALTADQPVTAASEPWMNVTDLVVIGGEWFAVVDGELLPLVEQFYRGASLAWTLAVQTSLPGWDTAVIPPVSQVMVEEHLSAARNRLVMIGDELWENARVQLLEGIDAGESIPELAARVRDAAEVTTPRATVIARTEVIAASNGGSIDVARMLGIEITKRWESTNDGRTRPSHVEAHGQERPLSDPFEVGGAFLDFPGDPDGPAAEVISCRCTTLYEVPDDTPPPENVIVAAGKDTQVPSIDCQCSTLTAAAAEHTGAMIALVPSDADAARLALDDYEPAEALHLTMAFLGEAADWSTEQRAALIDALSSAALPDQPIQAHAFGVNFWNPDSDDPSWNLAVGGGDLEDVHGAVWEQLLNLQGELALPIPENHRPWVAHVCLAYSSADLRTAAQQRVGDITFDRLRVAFAGENTDIPLAGRSKEDDMTTPTTAASAGTVALQAEEECPPGQHRMPDGSCMPDSEMAAEQVEHFHSLMIIEGVSTGLRTFSEGALTWREPPLALRWQVEEPESGGHSRSVHVGNIERIERVGNEIHGWGRLDLGDPAGLEFARKLAEGFAPWVSIGLDESLKEADVELVFPESDGGDDGMEMLFAEPEQIIFHGGRIAELTAVTVPALEQATIEATPELVEALAERGVVVAAGVTEFGAVAPHETGTSDEPWDGPANEARLPSPMSVQTARNAFAWIDDDRIEDGEIVKDAGRFVHHHVGENSQPGHANLTACSTGIGILNGGRGGTTIPRGDFQGVWNHLAKHLRDAGREPPPLTAADEGDATLTAASHTISIPDVPPSWWFDEPTDVQVDGAINITDEGRLYGMLGPSGVKHRGFRDRAVYIPMGNVDYGRWMNKTALVDFGDGRIGRINAGVITGDCGHCPTWATSDPAERVRHYDHSCAVFAKACIGEWASGPKRGVWIAGAIEPHVTADMVSQALGCDLSGDWGPHPERRGWQELCAALLVPVGGFAKARGPRAMVRDGALVASAMPVRFVRTERIGEPVPGGRIALEWMARSIGRDAKSRMADLRSRVHPEQGGQ